MVEGKKATFATLENHYRFGFFPIFISACNIGGRGINILMKCYHVIVGQEWVWVRLSGDKCLYCTRHHTWLNIKGERQTAVEPRILSRLSYHAKANDSIATFSIYLHDRGAKQSERSLHSHSAPWCWKTANGGRGRGAERARVWVKGHFKARRKNARPLLCVCLSTRTSERTSVCVLSPVTVCVCSGGIPLQGHCRGAWPLGVTVQTARASPFSTHSFTSLSSAFPWN